jgi:hypothetical protein
MLRYPQTCASEGGTRYPVLGTRYSDKTRNQPFS